jgi:CheY-like chemotaxis protein
VSADKDTLKRRNSDWLEGRATTAHGDSVLIVDDSESDIFFLLRAFASSRVQNPVDVVRSGSEAIDFLSGAGHYADRVRHPLPKIVFLDLRMPTPNGLDVLAWKQKQSNLPRMLWVAMSNFDSPRTINEAYAAGASTFLIKPLEALDIRNLIDAFNEFWRRRGVEQSDELASGN